MNQHELHPDATASMILTDLVAGVIAGHHVEIQGHPIHLNGLVLGPEAPENRGLNRAVFSTSFEGLDARVEIDDELRLEIEFMPSASAAGEHKAWPNDYLMPTLAEAVSQRPATLRIEGNRREYSRLRSITTFAYPLIKSGDRHRQTITVYALELENGAQLVSTDLSADDDLFVAWPSAHGGFVSVHDYLLRLQHGGPSDG